MKFHRPLLLAAMLASVVFDAETETGAAAPAETPKARKSVVPAGWKSKEDALAKFVNEQCTGKEGFEWPAFFALMRKNGVDETQVKKYEDKIAAKSHGAPGLAKMTLRNMLATIVRKNGKAVALDGTEVSIDLPKPAVTGAAAKAQAAAEEKVDA